MRYLWRCASLRPQKRKRIGHIGNRYRNGFGRNTGNPKYEIDLLIEFVLINSRYNGAEQNVLPCSCAVNRAQERKMRMKKRNLVIAALFVAAGALVIHWMKSLDLQELEDEDDDVEVYFYGRKLEL